ncbi:hypothetical protein GWK47_049880 [Chionoecetes opilio]|uniref:Uncharacterized protein n=1 Tax=Chionoecetes opilio TaxID=41210 RepID=A0A8J4Y3M9_CHIOP|nr:hypothetical protein GWK47_049880 [Chionoecetes opilio]
MVLLHGGFSAQVSFTPTSKAAPTLLQKQLALEHIAAVSSSVPAAPHLYVDGSLQPDGSAGCACLLTRRGATGGRLGWPQTTQLVQLYLLRVTGTLAGCQSPCQRRLNGVVMCDSQSALQAISSPQPTHRCLFIRSCFS